MSCCAPRRPVVEDVAQQPSRNLRTSDDGARLIPLQGGVFAMGSEDDDAVPGDGEGPVREVEVAPFAIDAVCVSNTRFAAFVDATGYATDAERYGWSFVFEAFTTVEGDRATEAPWWVAVPGAAWHAPDGPGSSWDDRADHPVVHVSERDARAYCRWARLRLPTEIEWEFAARGGLVQARFPWGDELTPHGEHRCNIWQGDFPTSNTLDDGWFGTAPVDAFEPNNYGLFNTSGNVWEWTADGWSQPQTRVIRGGSYLCYASYCNRYRVSARTLTTVDSSTGNQGFRVAL